MKRDSKFLTFALEQSEGNPRTLKGWPIKYGELSKVNEDSLGKWATRIKPFAFSESLKSADIKVFYEHDPKQILARRKNDSLKIKESQEGVEIEVTVGEKTSLQRDVYAMIEDGLVDQMSFGVLISDDRWIAEMHDGEEIEIREIQAGNVFEFSIVNSPAFENTSIAAFGSEQEREERVKDVEAAKAQEIAATNKLFSQKARLIELQNL